MTPSDAALLIEKNIVATGTVPGLGSESTPLEAITRNRDLWCKVAGERLEYIGKLKEALDAMRVSRDEALAVATHSEAVNQPSKTNPSYLAAENDRLEAKLTLAEIGRDEALKSRDETRAMLAAKTDKEQYMLEENFNLEGENSRLGADLEELVASQAALLAERDKAIAERDRSIADRNACHVTIDRLNAEIGVLREQLDSSTDEIIVNTKDFGQLSIDRTNLAFLLSAVTRHNGLGEGYVACVVRLGTERDKAKVDLALAVADRRRLDAELGDTIAMCNDALEACRKAILERDRARVETALAMADLEEAVAERRTLLGDLAVAVAERDRINVLFQQHVAMSEQPDDDFDDEDPVELDSEFDDLESTDPSPPPISLRIFVRDIRGRIIPGVVITVNEGYHTLASGTLDADGRFVVEIPMDEEGRRFDRLDRGGDDEDFDDDELPEASDSRSHRLEFCPASTMDLAALGSRIDHITGQMESICSGMRELGRFKDEAGRRVAMTEALLKNMGQQVELILARFDHPKMVEMLRPANGEPASWTSNIQAKAEASAR